jgi:hypothetical protein
LITGSQVDLGLGSGCTSTEGLTPNAHRAREDRIAEEYPRGTGAKPGGGTSAAQAFDDLFGGKDD